MGSTESMVWPPAMGMPAARHTSCPPRTMAPITSNGSWFTGMATSASAMMGVPPMAYTSDSALVAAMRPNSYGSSTIGMKKSVVATSAWSSFRR